MPELNLTPYEQQVLQGLASGKQHKQIAAELGKSPIAIDSCAKNIAHKARRSGYRFARILVKVESHGR